MMKKMISWLSFMTVFSLALQSCVHDEIYSSADPASKEYHSKSLWKEDEKYIRNVKQVFEEYTDRQYFSTKFGTVYWDYATTMGTYDEKFLEVPVIKNSKVNFILLVYRDEDRIFFKRKDAGDSKKFFQILVFTDREKHKVSGRIPGSEGSVSKSFCYIVETTVTWTNEDGTPGPTYSSSEMHCVSTGPTLPCQALDTESNCGGTSGSTGSGNSGSGSTGYPYPSAAQNPCEKLKAQNENVDFKNKVTALDKPEMFNKDTETGYAAAYGTVSFEQMWNTPNGNVRLPDGNKYFGYMHTHLNREGVIRIFSPYDVATFLTSCVANAKLKGNMADAYAMIITSQGNYILKYSGDGNFAVSVGQFETWKTWYTETYERLTSNQLTDPTILEKFFTQFLEEKVNINGVELYKVDKITGSATKLKYNGPDNPVQPIPCPN